MEDNNEKNNIYDPENVKCAEETIRICLEKGILTDFLTENREAVTEILLNTLESETE